MVAFMYSHSWIPTVRLNLSKKLIVLHHPGAAGFVMLEMYEAPVAELLAPAWQVLRYDVGMYIYFE